MKKGLLTLLFCSNLMFAEVEIPQVLNDNNFETSEYQLFITNTNQVRITEEMSSKLVFEGDISDYYEAYQKMIEKRFRLSEEATKRLIDMSKPLGNALYFNDVKSLNNIGIATVGSIALNSVLGTVLGDDTYVQVKDYYLNDELQTRLIKYLVSDDGLDEDEMQLVFNTTNNQSYHFRSGGFQSTFYK